MNIASCGVIISAVVLIAGIVAMFALANYLDRRRVERLGDAKIRAAAESTVDFYVKKQAAKVAAGSSRPSTTKTTPASKQLSSRSWPAQENTDSITTAVYDAPSFGSSSSHYSGCGSSSSSWGDSGGCSGGDGGGGGGGGD